MATENLISRELTFSKRSLVLIGNGIHCANVVEKFRTWIHEMRVPVVHSLLACDVLPYDDPLRVGMIGTYGNRYANMALAECDLLIVLGSRLDIRQTGTDVKFFENKMIIRVDIDHNELVQSRVHCNHNIELDLNAFFEMDFDYVSPLVKILWNTHINELKAKYPDTSELIPFVSPEGINPNEFMHQLSIYDYRKNVAAYVVDVGQHQMWAAQSLDLRSNQRFITSGGMGAMGFALPAAIGACFSYERIFEQSTGHYFRRPIVMIAGDAGFQLNIQELETVVKHRLPIKMVVINNNCHGMVRQFQQSYFKGNYQSTVKGYSAPEFTHIARAYGIATIGIQQQKHVGYGLGKLFENREPFLLQVDIEQNLNVYPKIAFGKPINEMEPDVKPIPME